MNVWWITLVPFIYSCSMMKSEQQEKILQAWVGRSVAELEGHKFFSHLPLKYKVMQGKTEIRNYEERGKYASKARSKGLGGGIGLPSEVCQNIFTIQDKIIQKYEMKESCLTNTNKMP